MVQKYENAPSAALTGDDEPVSPAETEHARFGGAA
jgi:hypothetical protein